MKLKLFNNKNKGTILIIGIIIIVIISIIMIYFLEKLFPIAKNIKGIENSTMAYYNALSGIEDAQLFMKTSIIGTESGVIYNTTNPKGFGYQLTASGSKIPIVGEGNSSFSGTWNVIGPGQPILLAIGTGITWSNVLFKFKAPDTLTLNPLPINEGMINWQLSGKTGAGTGLTIYASGETNMISRLSITNGSTIKLTDYYGFDLDGTNNLKIDTFYSLGVGLNSCNLNPCILKLTIVKPLNGLIPGQLIPYLQYQIDFATSSIPLQYARIESDGYSYGFRRHIRRDMKQYTTSESSDFTIIN